MYQVQKHRAGTERKIRKHGWTANYVYGEGEEDHIDFAYTIAFSDLRAPELIVFSLDPMLVNFVFWELFERAKAGRKLEDGFVFRPRDPELKGFECTLRSATKPETWSKYVFDAKGYSMHKGRGDKPPVMQIVWPSAENGKYPWSPECPATVIESQPALYETAPVSSRPVFGCRT